MDVSYDYYRIFYMVGLHHSFTRAAEALNNNQPNVTRCMNNLEHALGCKLFVRTNRGVTLTPEGERLFLRVSVAYEQLELGEEEIRQDCSLETGTISVGATETALHLILLERLAAFHAKYPGVHLSITNGSTPQIMGALGRGQVDLAVVTGSGRAKRPLRETRLCSFQEVLLCGDQYRELAEQPRRLADLEPYPFICLGRGSATYEFYQKLFLSCGAPFRVNMEAATMDQVMPMIRYNMGIGFCVESLAKHHIESGRVWQVPLLDAIPQRTISLIEDTSRPLSVAARALKQLLCRETPERT